MLAEYNIPVVITCHGPDIMGYNESNRYHNYANKAAKECKKIIAISDDSKQRLIKIYGKYKDKISIIPNGYNPNLFYREKYSKEEFLKLFNINGKYDKIICFAGRLDTNKGIDILLNSAKIYDRDNVLTLIAGYGSEYQHLVSLRRKLGLKNVVFLGNQCQENLRKMYSVSDVCAVPSRQEAFGLVALEAIACGTPVVATNQGGMVDFITKDVGMLVDKENPNELAKAINKILNEEKVFDKEYLQKYAKDNYSQEIFMDKLIDIYEEIKNKDE